MILYFSGTGNSRYVAEQLGRLLGDDVCRLLSVRGLCDAERVIWVFPTYSWGVPPVVKQCMSGIQFKPGSKHFLVTTCGDDIGNCHKMWRKLISDKGSTAVSSFSVQMPNTYVFMKGFDVDSKEVESQKISSAKVRIAEIAHKIQDGNEQIDDVVRGSFPWIKTTIIYPFFVRFYMNPIGFQCGEKCVSCGKCAKNCPLQNISMTNGKPEWGSNCAFCLRCYHVCPLHAIDYKNTAACKGQYLFPNGSCI